MQPRLLCNREPQKEDTEVSVLGPLAAQWTENSTTAARVLWGIHTGITNMKNVCIENSIYISFPVVSLET